MYRRSAFAGAMLLLALFQPRAAGANARLVAVTPQNGGCVAGPTGPNVESWDVQPGMTYTVRLDNLTNCANGGTDLTINVLIMSSALGNTPIVANRVATGVYEFSYTPGARACATTPIRYCVSDGKPNSGFVVGRHDTGTSQSHLRAATFSAGCTNPTPVDCNTPARISTWGTLKSYYR